MDALCEALFTFHCDVPIPAPQPQPVPQPWPHDAIELYLLFPQTFAGPLGNNAPGGKGCHRESQASLTVASLSPGLGPSMFRYLFVKIEAVDFREDPANTAIPTADQNPECVKLLE